MPKLVTELWDRCEHAADELDRPLEQLGVLAHREDPSARNSDQSRRLRPLDQQGQAVQLGAALDREALIENVAGIQQLHQRERVHTSEPTSLRQRAAGADPAHESAHPGDHRRAGGDRREIITRHATRPASPLRSSWMRACQVRGLDARPAPQQHPRTEHPRAPRSQPGTCRSRSVLRCGHNARVMSGD